MLGVERVRGDFIHPDFFVAIAKIIAHIMKQKGAKAMYKADEDAPKQRSVRMGKSMSDEQRTDLGLGADGGPPPGTPIN